MRSARGFGIALLACTVAVAACQGSTGTSPSTSASQPVASAAASSPVGPGTSQAVVAGKPVSMTLLSNWRKVDLTEAGIRAIITSLGGTNPQLTATLNQLLASGGYLRLSFYALGYDGGRYLGNANIAETPLPAADLAALGPLLEAQLRSLGAKSVSTSTVALPAGEGLRLSYTLEVVSGTSTVTVTGRLFVFSLDGVTYNVTFTCGGPDPGPCLAQADQMIQTFRIGS